MKKFISITLVLLLILSFAACGNKQPAEDVSGETEQTDILEETTDKDEDVDDKQEDTEAEKEESKPETKPQQKPEPEKQPEPAPEPEKQPEPAPETTKSVGNILLDAFKSKASSSNALQIAEALVSNSVIAFSGGAMPVEPGYLTGFDDTEIKGFKEGAMFAPMIGTIPFVGYVFTLEDSTDVSSFISTLKSAANLRWNICTSADEMVTGSVGNKVFFVMSPTNFDAE